MLNLNTLFHSFTQNPKSLFLLDGVGATVTALLLGVVLRHFQPFLGMTMPVLTALAVVALVFCVYSLSCYMRLPWHVAPFLWVIAVANSLYCMSTLTLVWKYSKELSPIGLVYFVLEIIIILALVFVEVRVARAL